MKSREGVQLDVEPFALEKKELDAVLASGIFAVSSNAAKLLRFVCEKHFQNAADTITESDVAIHALGRRPDFDPQRDSIVRVETHRVRKRLQEYYQNRRRSPHPVKIVLSARALCSRDSFTRNCRKRPPSRLCNPTNHP